MDFGLTFLYHTLPGRIVLKVLASRQLSVYAGRFLDSPLSRPLIGSFVEKNHIDLSECVSTDFTCFNDCFTRRLKPSLRPIDREPEHLISPCDGLLRVWKISDDTVLPVKESQYRVSDLLGSAKLAKRFEGGTCLVFRLCVNHYHRYCYVDDGVKSRNVFLPGKLHTVRPIALRALPLLAENCREVTLMKTENFGTLAQVEVGAMLVGRIQNHHGAGEMHRGDEKGMFLYGGSTIVLLLPKSSAVLDPRILAQCRRGKEVPVKMGQCIGKVDKRV